MKSRIGKTLSLSLCIFLINFVLNVSVFAENSSPSAGDTLLKQGMGNYHHAVSTINREAQRFFDQGLTLVYVFNHDEAIRSFEKAAELDPKLAMAYWGIALALGPNINQPIDPDREKAAYKAVQKALELSASAPRQERAYIEALAKRYSDDPKADLKTLDINFKNAMGDLVRSYPDDLDAATLYAESMMDLRPWQLWNLNGAPAEGTEEIVSVLESVIRRNPNHPGANHYYIHTVEASQHPEWALPSAERLRALVPAAGHLVHMPAHIYSRTGFYEEAALSNEAAIAADELYFRERKAPGIYMLGYYSHNIHFLAVAKAMEGRFQDAKKAADKLTAHVATYIKDNPWLEGFAPHSILVLVRFHHWEDILKTSPPDAGMVMTNAFWRFAMGMAYASTGKIEDAKDEKKTFLTLKGSLSADVMFSQVNSAIGVLSIAEDVLAAKIAAAEGNKKQAIELLKRASEKEDKLNYDEPENWYIPSRESLGAMLIFDKNYNEAEKVFREDLKIHPRSGRSLFGLYESLKAQGKDYEAQLVNEESMKAWEHADTKLRLEDL